MNRRLGRLSRRFGVARLARSIFPLYGLRGFDGASQLAAAAGQGLRGSTSGHWVAVWHVIDAKAGNTEKELVRNTDPGDAAGYRFSVRSTSSWLEYVCTMTGPATVVSPQYTIAAGDVGKLMLSWGVWDQPNGRLRLFPKNGVEQGAGTSTALNQLVASASNTMTVGRYNISGVNFADQNTILGVMGGDGFVPTPSEIAAADAALKATGVLTPVPGKTTHAWSVGSTWNGTLTASVGGQNLSMIAGVAADLDLATLTTGSWA